MISRKTRKEGRVRRLGRIFDTDHVSVYLIIERYRSNNRSIYDVCLDVQTKKEKKNRQSICFDMMYSVWKKRKRNFIYLNILFMCQSG